MKRHAPPRGIKPVIAPFAVENEYRIEMDTLIRAMAKDIHTEVMAIYRPWLEMQQAAIVGDASVVDLLVGAFNKLRARWGRRATPVADQYAPAFVAKVDNTVSLSFTRMLKSVSVDPKDVPKANRLQGKAMEVTLDAAVAENVALIKSIPAEYIDSVQRDVLLAVQGGWPLGQLSDALKKRYGITRRRAELIARDQCAKVTGRMNQQRSLAAGFTEADWWHSAGSRYPRKLHMQANGKRFKLAEGCEIGGEHILCGQKINCFPGDTLINLSQGCHTVWRYKYRGKINTLNTGSGIIRATPNHPILTSRGWVPINAIKAGDYVWKTRSEIINSGVGNQNNAHTSFENLFESLRLKSGSTLRNGAAFDFHGDIPDNEVETVRVEHNLGLEGNIQFLKEACKLHLTNTNTSIGGEDVSGANVLESSFPGVGGDFNPFHFAHAAHADVSGFTSTTRLNTHSLKSINHKNAAAVDCFADSENANFFLMHIGDDFISISRSSGVTKVSLYGGGIITDEVLSKFVSTYPEMAGKGFYCGETFFERLRVSDEIGREDYSGHVYTLQSYSGYYMASTENIATKNCKCFFTVVVPGRS